MEKRLKQNKFKILKILAINLKSFGKNAKIVKDPFLQLKLVQPEIVLCFIPELSKKEIMKNS
jgi:hypothetical protein